MSLIWVRYDESFKRGSNFIRQRVKLHRRLKARSPGLAPAVGVRFEALSRSSASRAFIVTAPRTARRQHSTRDRSAPSHNTLAHPRTPRDHVRVGRSHGLGQPGATRAAPIARSLPAPHPSPAAPALRRAAAGRDGSETRARDAVDAPSRPRDARARRSTAVEDARAMPSTSPRVDARATAARDALGGGGVSPQRGRVRRFSRGRRTPRVRSIARSIDRTPRDRPAGRAARLRAAPDADAIHPPPLTPPSIATTAGGRGSERRGP